MNDYLRQKHTINTANMGFYEPLKKSTSRIQVTVNDLKAKGITPVYLVSDHIGFYERYGWEFLCMVQGDGEPEMTRMYIHR